VRVEWGGDAFVSNSRFDSTMHHNGVKRTSPIDKKHFAFRESTDLMSNKSRVKGSEGANL
jgi:hypothetical protein